ncbi:hypothetical protein EVAR_74881_1 [Eumeta japonica]|uniref:Uncharacterized protein n=1 Tax=Eumeta variegata TaxID=151549 RepID=A0A4C1SSE5_EUMVA|nr:hypothetical protein EVAR_74881_1 [Eumeta japonica]
MHTVFADSFIFSFSALHGCNIRRARAGILDACGGERRRNRRDASGSARAGAGVSAHRQAAYFKLKYIDATRGIPISRSYS